MSRARKAPPASPAPFNMDEVEIVRRKVAPPAGPPPAGLTSFKAPRKVEARGRDRSPSPDYDDHGRRSRSRSRSPSPEYRGRGPRRSRSRSRSGSPRRERGEMKARYDSRSPSPDRDWGREHRRYRDEDSPDHMEERDEYGRRESSDVFDENSHAVPKHERSDSLKEYIKKLPDTKDAKAAAASVTEQESVFNFNILMKTTYRELRSFIMSPPPANTVVRCYIERNAGGANMFNPVYSLCADLDDGTGRELICCRKITSRSAHYVFSLKSDDLYRKRDQRSRLYLGKLRATSANEYVLYDGGSCDVPEGAGSELLNNDRSDTSSEMASKAVEDSLYRSQLAVIHFNSKKRPCPADERGMEVCIPHPSLVVTPPTVAEGTSTKKILVDIVNPFEKVRHEGKQNELFRHKLLVYHERVSR